MTKEINGIEKVKSRLCTMPPKTQPDWLTALSVLMPYFSLAVRVEVDYYEGTYQDEKRDERKVKLRQYT